MHGSESFPPHRRTVGSIRKVARVGKVREVQIAAVFQGQDAAFLRSLESRLEYAGRRPGIDVGLCSENRMVEPKC
jgi:hypothetical protein